MKIRHSAANYILPGFLVVLLFAGGGFGDDAEVAMLIMGVAIVVLCALGYATTSLSVENGMVTGRAGFLFPKTLSTPVTNINGCSITKMGFWNKIKITSGLTVYELKNMEKVDAFKAAIDAEQARMLRR